MRNSKWVVFAVALGMMAVTAGWLKDIRGRRLLGPAGVKVGQSPIYDEKTNVVSTQSVILPIDVLGMESSPRPIYTIEAETLPRDTTFGRRYYFDPKNDFGVQTSVVLMGTDHTSIHQPQYCLDSYGWNITNTSRISLRMDHPFAYDIPAIKLTATRPFKERGGTVECIYIYWFVSADKITAEEGSRLWSMWKTVLQKGKLERWAYISYFATCLPGHEQSTFESLEKFIRASAPEFQLVTGKPADRSPPIAGPQ